MEDRLKGLALGAARVVLVGLALVLALGAVANSAVKTFCPEAVSASAEVVAAAGASVVLATVVEDESVAPGEPAIVPSDDATAPSEPAAPTPTPAEEPVPDGSCAGGVRACAPPLLSSVLRYGDDACTEQAPAALRGRVLPPLLGAIVLLGGAWALRPRYGEPVLSRE